LSARKLVTAWILIGEVVLFLFLLGCDDNQSALEAPVAAPRASRLFDARATGTITGQVTWKGEVPIVDPFIAPVSADSEWLRWPNPNAPVVDSQSKGVGNAIVFLRGVDPEKAKPWDLATVCVEQRDYQLHVLQGGMDGRLGFVRRGDAVEIVSRQNAFHSLRAGGAAFFTLAFPDPDDPLSRRLTENGVVELSSAAVYFWMRAYLFVDEHPYYCRTDEEGRFKLEQVPAGNYELVCWLPNWHMHGHDRDPETTRFSRWYFAAPLEMTQSVSVKSGVTCNLGYSASACAFATK
jgi:hypothetical protein